MLLGTVGEGAKVVVRYERGICDDVETNSARALQVIVQGEVTQRFTLEVQGQATLCSGIEEGLEKGDFNFDGLEDFAVPLDLAGPYGSPTYVIFILDRHSRRYLEAPALSVLTRDFMGMFVANAKKRRLVASSKSGCCIHWTSEFVVNGRTPVLYSTETLGDSLQDGSCMVSTELYRPNAKTKTTKRRCTRDEQE
jgi:hypothetical protein